jgi:hypothetical protein
MLLMTDAFTGNRIELALDWAASLIFAALVGYACWMVGGTKLAAVGAAAAFMIGAGLLAKLSPAEQALPTFELQPLEQIAGDDPLGELLLDDPLTAPGQGSRVVSLFAPVDRSPAALVARIEDYLGREPQRAGANRGVEEAPRPMVDASAALHAALSNIRASLR